MTQPAIAPVALADALELYGRVAVTGSRDPVVLERLTLLPSESVRQRLRVLMDLGLIEADPGSLRLPPIDAAVLSDATGFDSTVIERVAAQQRYWDEWRPPREDGAVLHGARGYWEHWWNLIVEWDRPEALAMDAVMPARPGWWGRNWLEFIHRGWLEKLTTDRRMTVRLIVPVETAGSVAEDLVDLVRAHLGEVRVLDAPEWFTLYGARALVVPEELGDEFGGDCRLVRQPQVVDAFQQRFEELWATAAPWAADGHGVVERVLRLLATGLQDDEVAAQLGITPRTVRRHVAKAMKDAGAETRFQLGALYSDRRVRPGKGGVR